MPRQPRPRTDRKPCPGSRRYLPERRRGKSECRIGRPRAPRGAARTLGMSLPTPFPDLQDPGALRLQRFRELDTAAIPAVRHGLTGDEIADGRRRERRPQPHLRGNFFLRPIQHELELVIGAFEAPHFNPWRCRYRTLHARPVEQALEETL